MTRRLPGSVSEGTPKKHLKFSCVCIAQIKQRRVSYQFFFFLKGHFHGTAHVHVMTQAKSLLLFTDQSEAICQYANPARILSVSWNFRES